MATRPGADHPGLRKQGSGLKADITSFSIQVSELGKTTKEAQALANGKMSSILQALRSFQMGDGYYSTAWPTVPATSGG